MAGIGFELRKMTRRDDLLSIVQGYTHSALASAGPWLFTILALVSVLLFGPKVTSLEELASFRLILIYNFAFSLVLSGPIVMVATRCLADMIHDKNVEEAPAMMLGCLVLLYATQILIVGPFYLFYVDLNQGARLAGLVNFFLITGIWLVSLFLTALKNYNAVTGSFAVGMLLAIGSAAFLARHYSVTGMLLGFNTGLAAILFSLIARIFAEYPYRVIRLFPFLDQLAKYWEIALGGFVYNLAIWVDKWIMWFSPHRELLPNKMMSYPDYDSAMFLAYLSIVPSMAVFVFSVETDFFEKYLRFYRDIQRHANYARIQRNHQAIVRTLLESARNFMVLQGGICFMTIVLAPRLFDILDLNFIQLGMFRLGVLGAFFHVLLLLMSIILYYFDLRRATVGIHSLFLVTNAVFTCISMKMGFAYYGYGYFLSALVTFVVTLLVTAHYVVRLPYQTFVRSNTSVR